MVGVSNKIRVVHNFVVERDTCIISTLKLIRSETSREKTYVCVETVKPTIDMYVPPIL